VAKRLFLATILAGALVTAADATIVVQHGVAGVSLGMSQKKVRSVLGSPKKVVRARNTFGRFVEYRYPGLTVDFQGAGSLSNVSTTRRSERTAKGVGIGSTRKQVEQNVRGAKCQGAVCKVGKQLAGRIVTTFYLQKDHVILLAVGRVLD
jgi:hypothetical protein